MVLIRTGCPCEQARRGGSKIVCSSCDVLAFANPRPHPCVDGFAIRIGDAIDSCRLWEAELWVTLPAPDAHRRYVQVAG
jgi:hypothetical protein